MSGTIEKYLVAMLLSLVIVLMWLTACWAWGILPFTVDSFGKLVLALLMLRTIVYVVVKAVNRGD